MGFKEHGLHQAPRARSMIGSLMYLTSSRPDIMFACKKQTVVATSSTKAEYMAAASCYAQTATASTCDNGEIELTATIDGYVKTITEASVMRHLKLVDANDEAASTGVDDRHRGTATTVSSLDA
nr:hypothetical protein [Tanacetum cinerariifolium]